MRIAHFFLVLIFVLPHLACDQLKESQIYNIQKSAASAKGMVVTAHPLATEAGIEILKKGGNAADAAVAVQFTLAVVYPRAGNLGGGGFMTYRNHLGEIFTLDFREKAPEKAYRDMYLDSTGNIIIGLAQEGILSVGVPGTVAGLFETHKKFGRLRWQALLEPATRLARTGFRLTAAEAKRLNDHKDVFLNLNKNPFPFISVTPWKEGDVLRQEDLAVTLQLIANHGKDGFYSGENAKYLIAAIDSNNGLITLEDLSAYQAIWRQPVSFPWREYEVHSVGPPSSGGIMLGQLLKMIEYRLTDSLGPYDAGNVHLIVEAERRSYADRSMYLGDNDFFPVPVDSIMSREYLDTRFSDFNPLQASVSGTVDSAIYYFAKESPETTHLSIVDADGNAASVTTTLNGNYGSKIWVPKGGYFLNNEMDDFSIKTGAPNIYGLIGGEANSIEPNKRMLSSMTPAIIEKSGKLFMVLGTPGGSTIITSVLQVILNHTAFKMNIDDAVQAKRYHHQWLPDEIIYEKGAFSQELIHALDSIGHTLREVETIGAIEAISVDENGILRGAADNRGDDHAAGL